MRYLFLILINSVLLFGEYLFVHEAMFERARQSEKIPMLVVGATTCTWTDRLKEETLVDTDVIDFIEKHFVLVKVDQDFDDVPIYLQAEFTPTTQFMNYKGEIFWQSIGFKSANAYLDELKNVRLMWQQQESP